MLTINVINARMSQNQSVFILGNLGNLTVSVVHSWFILYDKLLFQFIKFISLMEMEDSAMKSNTRLVSVGCSEALCTSAEY